MKKRLWLMVPVLALAACNVQPVEEYVPSPIEVTLSADNFGFGGGSAMATITCGSDAWTAQMKEGSWCKITNAVTMEGVGGQITLQAEGNTTYDSRVDTLIVKTNYLEKRVPITQVQKDGLMIYPTEVTLECDGGTFSVTVDHNVEYELVISDEWITLAQTKGLVKTTCDFVVAANETPGKERSGSVQFLYNGVIMAKVSVSQAAPDPILAVTTPGLYKLETGDFCLKAGESQYSFAYYAATKSMIVRFVYPITLNIMEIRGISKNLAKGEAVDITVKNWIGGSPTTDLLYSFNVVDAKNGMIWLRAASNPEIYMVISLEDL